jgi:hypothetical protein
LQFFAEKDGYQPDLKQVEPLFAYKIVTEKKARQESVNIPAQSDL